MKLKEKQIDKIILLLSCLKRDLLAKPTANYYLCIHLRRYMDSMKGYKEYKDFTADDILVKPSSTLFHKRYNHPMYQGDERTMKYLYWGWWDYHYNLDNSTFLPDEDMINRNRKIIHKQKIKYLNALIRYYRDMK